MSATQEKILSKTTWLRVATGQGDVVITSHGPLQHWAITESNEAPTLSKGHACPIDENVSMTLVAGEHLWMRGPGVASVTAVVPVSDVL